MNITSEPKAWFDLVTACGLDDVRATSLADMVASPPSVRQVSEALVPRFAQTFGREFIPLEDGREVDDELRSDIEGVKEIVRVAEEAAAKAKEENGGVWPTKPSVK